MREILFRGKDIDTGEWAYGAYLPATREICEMLNENGQHDYDTAGILEYLVSVDPETVGQFTGQYDRKNVKIFEGDIVRASYYVIDYGNHVTPMHTKKYENVVCEIIYDYAKFSYRNPNSIYKGDLMFSHCECEVIGNITEHKNILEEVQS